MASEDHISQKYLVLKPDEASLLDLFRFLFSGNIKSRQFIECLRVKEISIKRRGYIFLSMFVQKALQYVAKPLSLTGSIFELWLNVLASNENFVILLLNFLRGKVVMPAEESANFLSTLGHLDRRLELDKNIKPGDKKYFAGLCVMASKIAYENRAFIRAVVEDQWKMELIGAYDFWNGNESRREHIFVRGTCMQTSIRLYLQITFNYGYQPLFPGISYTKEADYLVTTFAEYQQKNSTQGFILHDKNDNPDMIIVAFRGTELFNADDWSTDFDLSWYKFQSMGKVHSGFMKALGLQMDQSWPPKIEDNSEHLIAYYTIRDELRKILELNNQTKFILTGHSLGGALAALFPAVLALHNETCILERLEAIYSFGQPRVGDEQFGEFMNDQLKRYGIRYYRFIYNHDIVPRLPYDDTTLLFRHFGTCLYYNSLYEGKIVPQVAHKNYFSLGGFIVKRIDALWELVRSFLLPHIYGQEYEEGLLLKASRFFGLLIPGLPAHGIQEYVNVIRLGTADLFD